MTPQHAAIIALLRDAIDEARGSKGGSVPPIDDATLVRMLFANWRGAQARGLRLTNLGLQFMKSRFQSIEVRLTGPTTQQARGLLYLDRRATLPYHLAADRLTLFETDLAILLRLVDGDLGALMEIDAA